MERGRYNLQLNSPIRFVEFCRITYHAPRLHICYRSFVDMRRAPSCPIVTCPACCIRRPHALNMYSLPRAGLIQDTPHLADGQILAFAAAEVYISYTKMTRVRTVYVLAYFGILWPTVGYFGQWWFACFLSIWWVLDTPPAASIGCDIHQLERSFQQLGLHGYPQEIRRSWR